MRWLSRLTTILIIALVVVGFGLLIRRKLPKNLVGQSFVTCAIFRDGSKLATGSPVMIAGVRVGDITNLSISGGFARIEMHLRDDTEVPVDSWVTKRAYSPFGDSYIEIIPSGGETGAATGQRLSSGQCLSRVSEGSSTDRMLRSLERTMPAVDDGLERVSEVSTYGRKWALGTLEDKALDADQWLQEGHIERPLASAESALARLESGATGAAVAVHGAMPTIDRTLDRLERGVTSARSSMQGLQTDLREGLQKARDGMNGVDDTIADIQEVVSAVDEGRGNDSKGTLGRLINDPTLANDIEEATDSLREGAASLNHFKSWLGLRIEMNYFSAAPRFFVTAEIRARSDKFYLVEFEKGPLGGFPKDEISDASGVSTYTRHEEIEEAVRFTAQFGKTFGNWFQIRGGIKESAFGFGADMLLGEGRLKLSADLYGGVDRTPRLKVAGALAVFRSIYLLGGVDDALNDPRYLRIRAGGNGVPTQFDKVRFGRDYFLGATLYFDDADLAMLIRVYGALLAGML